MEYSFFLDETGDHGLSFIDKSFPLFLLCGVLVKNDKLLEIEAKLNELKTKYFKSINVNLHSRDIRKCEGSFQVLFDLTVKAEFYKDLNNILGKSDYIIIGAGVNKEEHIKKYGKGAKNPYNLSLSFIIERLIFCLNSLDKNAMVKIFAEERGKREDGQLISHYNSIIDRGTYFVQPDNMKRIIKEFIFKGKKANILGLQVADLIAYPLARHILNPKEPYIPFEVIKDKIYCNAKKEVNGWGLKVFP